TSEVAVSRSSASSRSRRSCANSPSAPAVEELLRRDAGAEPRFGIALRLRALVGLLLALERRRIAHPKGLGLRRFSKKYYSRDLRLEKWGSWVSLHGGSQKVQPMQLHQRSAARRTIFTTIGASPLRSCCRPECTEESS